MDARAMIPYGRALRAYHRGDHAAALVIRRDDGYEATLPVRHFFRPPAEFTAIEREALGRCRGRVLDVGAGTGLHALALQEREVPVTALDLDEQAIEIMRERGVRDLRRADILEFNDGPFDTLLLLGHGIGMVETMAGLARCLAHLRRLVDPAGQVLLDSLDVSRTDDSAHRAYHEAARRAGRAPGEVRVQFEFAGEAGPFCGWLHVEPASLDAAATREGWRCTVVRAEESGDYLARLVPAGA